MLKLRRQLPVYSPIRPASLAAGFGAALGLGRPRERLAAHLQAHYGTSDVLLTDSGTSALRLAIRGGLEVGGGDVVALPAYCCYDVATAAIGAEARVRLYDVNPSTLGPDWDSLDETLSAGVSAVVAVHLYGVPVDMERLTKLARARRVLVIEDAAQGFGGSIAGRPLGSVGSLSVLSFGRGKGVTGGGGGALLANDEPGRRVLSVVRERPARGRRGWNELLRLAGQWLLGRPAVYGLPASLPWLGLGETHYAEPWKPRDISRAAAAAVVANWKASMTEADQRKKNAARLAVDVALDQRVPAVLTADSHVGALRQPILVDEDVMRGRSASEARTLGAETGYPYLPGLPALAGPDVQREHPGAARLAQQLWTLPTHSLSDPTTTIGGLEKLQAVPDARKKFDRRQSRHESR